MASHAHHDTHKAKHAAHDDDVLEAEPTMPAGKTNTLDEVCTELKTNASLKASCVFAFKRIADRFTDAMIKAVNAGASPMEMATVKHEIDGLNISANDLAAAIAMGTPAEKIP